jgi:UDP-N-acetylmuramyl pentapeptide phosphotransferase/UDP-N-acetylglucosamine-1-phosphate transferase
MEISYSTIIYTSVFSALLMFFGIKFVELKMKNFFGVCFANEKTSLYHKPMVRGLGLLYIIALIPMFLFNNLLLPSDVFIIVISTMLGFCDDKYGISQIKKIFLLLVIIVSQNYFYIDINNFLISDYFIDIILFLFLTLFFNQIDGINGLAGSTFSITCLGVLILFNDMIMLQIIIPIICVILIYLNTNLRGNIGIQGEAGSFFMGSVMFVLFQKFQNNFDWIYIFIFLFPIFSDVICTTIIRLIFVKNLFISHRKHLYQRLVEKYKNHVNITILFSLIQVLSCCTGLYLYNLEFSLYKFFGFVTFVLFFLIINIRFSYLIHKERF